MKSFTITTLDEFQLGKFVGCMVSKPEYVFLFTLLNFCVFFVYFVYFFEFVYNCSISCYFFIEVFEVRSEAWGGILSNSSCYTTAK